MTRNWLAFLILSLFGLIVFVHNSLSVPIRTQHQSLDALLGKEEVVKSFSRVDKGEALECRVHDDRGLLCEQGHFISETWLHKLMQVLRERVRVVPSGFERFVEGGAAFSIGADDWESEVHFQFGRYNSYFDQVYLHRRYDDKVFLVSPLLKDIVFSPEQEMFDLRLFPVEPESIEKVVRMTPNEVVTIARHKEKGFLVDSQEGDALFLRGWLKELTELRGRDSEMVRSGVSPEPILTLIVSAENEEFYVRVVPGGSERLSSSSNIFYAFVEGKTGPVSLLSGEEFSRLNVRREAFLSVGKAE